MPVLHFLIVFFNPKLQEENIFHLLSLLNVLSEMYSKPPTPYESSQAYMKRCLRFWWASTYKFTRGMSRTKFVLVTIVLPACFILFILNVLELWSMRDSSKESTKIIMQRQGPKYAVFTNNSTTAHLTHVYDAFKKLGYIEVPTESLQWDVLWSHPYPFALIPALKFLQPHQKVNHIPGSGFFTNKVNLATLDSQYVPKAFRLPEGKQALLEHVKKNPDVELVQKSNSHRGIRVLKLSQLDLNADGSFVQEFVSKPLLVDGYKFDIGVYTILTSVDPLRAYVYMGDVLFRFCPEKYYPFDAKNVDKYVIGNDYLPTWKVPSLKKFYVYGGFSMKDSFDAYIRIKGMDPTKVWNNVQAAIREIFLRTEPAIINLLRKYKSKRNFFEMVRFDFAVDEDLNVFIMEANMSPNLSSQHFPPNALLYEQVLFNILSLVGIGQHIHTDTLSRTKVEKEMQASSKQLGVYPEECSKCDICLSPSCQLCNTCMTSDTRETLWEAYREHVNRLDTRRIFPPPMTREEAEKEFDPEGLSPENQLMYRWFRGKCLQDLSWCQ